MIRHRHKVVILTRVMQPYLENCYFEANLKFQHSTEPSKPLLQRSIRLQSCRSAPHGVAYRRILKAADNLTDLAQTPTPVPPGNQHRQLTPGIAGVDLERGARRTDSTGDRPDRKRNRLQPR